MNSSQPTPNRPAMAQAPNLRQGAPRNAPGGVGARFVAVVIDGVVCGIVNYPISMVLSSLLGVSKMAANPQHLGAQFFVAEALIVVLAMVVPALYFGYFYSVKGASLGKMAMSLKVVNASDGTNLSFGKAAMRDSIGKFVSAMVFMIGYLMAIFRSDKRALHDLMAGSQVISSK